MSKPSASRAGTRPRRRIWSRWWVWAIAGAVAIVAALWTYHWISGGRPGRAARHAERAEQYRLGGDLGRARLELRTAIEILPTDGHLRFLLGRVEEASSNFSEALGHYQAAVAVNPHDALARAALARLYLFSSQMDEALATVSQGIALDPNAPRLLALRAEIQMRRPDLSSALRDATAAAALAPTDEYVASMLAAARQQNGDADGALAAIRTALEAHPSSADLRAILADLLEFSGRREDALFQVRQLVQLQPQSMPFRARLARLLLLMERPNEAEQALRDAVRDINSDDARLEIVKFQLQRKGQSAAAAEVRGLIAANLKNPNVPVHLGRFLLDEGMAEEAEKIFIEAIARYPDRVEVVPARTALAGLRLAAGRQDEARSLAEEVLARTPQNSEALLVRARLAMLKGDPQSAITDLRTVLRGSPDSLPALRELVQAYAATGDSSLAEESVRRALDGSPDDKALKLTLAQLLLNSHREAEAISLLKQVALADPKSIEAHEGLFQAALALQRYDEARAAALAEQSVAPTQALGYFRLAQLEQAQGRLTEAEAALQQALTRSDGRGEPLAAMIRLLVQRGQANRALAMVDAALERAPQDSELHVFRGDLLTGRPALGDAIHDYQRAVELAPGWPVAYRSLAAAHMARKQPDAALATLRAGAARVNASVADGVLSDLAGLSESIGRHDDAIAAYEQALKAAPNNVVYANNLALLLVTYRNDPASLQRADQLVDRLANLSAPAILDTRGWVKYRTGSSAAAVSILQQAVDALPDEPSIRYHLAVVQHALGDHVSARANLTRALASSQSFAERPKAEALLVEVKQARRRG